VVDSTRNASDPDFAMDDEDRPLRRGDAASLLSKESLDSYSREELDERIVLLEAEIERVKAHKGKSEAHRLAAEAFFKPRTS
jgi:uncharacterized small protein (DUF1192 family)